MLLVAVAEGRTLSGVEEAQYRDHLAGCDRCRALTVDTEHDRARWIARIPEDALDDRDLPVLPTVDPIVFIKGDDLAQGGMGRITRARDRRLGREVAIKQVLAPDLRARFEREALITARLQHPAIVPIYEAGVWPDGSAFYTMRLVSGGTLAAAISSARTLEARLALLPHVIALTEAVAYAHSQRIVHRDLKPANVLVGEFGETVVIDWGLAKELDRSAGARAGSAAAGDPAPGSPELTHAGAVIGTPCFMAPEQAAGDDVDERADVYALGAILYTLLAGDPPYWDRVEHSTDRLVDAARHTPPTPIADRAPRAPRDLRAIIERAMARDPRARYPTGREMAEELRRFEAGQLIRSREYGARELVARWIRRHRAAVAVGAAAIAVLAAGGVVSVQQIVAHQRETERALAETQLERGRQLLVDGDPAQAAPYLAAAYAAQPADPIAQRLASAALRDAPRRLGRFAGTTAAFRPGGRDLAIGRGDGSIAVIDLATSAVLRTLPPHGGEIAQLAYSPDGALLAVAAATGAELRDAGSGDLRATARGAAASEVRFVGGDRLAIATATAVLLIARDGTVMARDPAPGPRALEVSADGARLAAITRDGALAWRASDLARIAEVRDGSTPRFAATLDRGELITAGLDGVRRWSSERVTQLVAEPTIALAWLADGRLLAGRSIIAPDIGAIHQLANHSIQAVAIIDRTHAITGGYDHALRLWDLERADLPGVVLDTEAATWLLVVDPTGRRAASRGRGPDAAIELWDIARPPAPVRTATLGARTMRIDAIVSDHRDRLAVHTQDDGIQRTELVTTGLERIATLTGWPLGFRPGSDELAADDAGRIALYAGRDGAHLRDIADPEPIWHVAFSRSGAAIATSSEHRVALRDAGWQVVASFPVPSDVSALALDDGGLIATGHADGTLRIWNARAGALLATAAGHTASITDLAIRAGALVSNSWDLTARRWAFPSGQPLGAFKRFDKVVDAVETSPGGALIATTDGTAVVSLWDAAQGRLIAQLATAGPLGFATFIDDDHVVAGGNGGRLEVIDASMPVRPVASVTREVAASRWRLVGGRAVDQLSGLRGASGATR